MTSEGSEMTFLEREMVFEGSEMTFPKREMVPEGSEMISLSGKWFLRGQK